LTSSSDTVIAALDTRVETLETNFTSLDTRVETTETDITALQDDVNNLGTNLDTLTNDVTGLTASYNDHITAFENEQEFTNGLGVVQGQHTTEIAALTTQLTNHIASITAALDAAKTDLQTQITALSGRVTVTESLIAALQTKTSTMSDTAKQTQAEVTIETHVDSGKNYVDVPAYVGKPIVFVDRDFMHEGRDYMKDTEVSTRFWFSELQLPDAVCSVVYEAV
jgi:chromosome segregation ATPase